MRGAGRIEACQISVPMSAAAAGAATIRADIIGGAWIVAVPRTVVAAINPMAADNERTDGLRLLRAVDLERDHARGGGAQGGVVNLVVYGDYLCPYCRRLRLVLS